MTTKELLIVWSVAVTVLITVAGAGYWAGAYFGG